MANKKVKLCLHVSGETEAAFFVCEDETKPELQIPVPKSQIEVIGMNIENICAGDTVDFIFPEWLAIQKGLV